jgi:diguanylate cyclase (GGDEF)-like protein
LRLLRLALVAYLAILSALLSPLALAGTTLNVRFAPQLRHYDSDQGLPQNSVTALLKDRAGYLWIGTFGGLVRYDGHDFRIYGSHTGNGPPSDRISALLEDPQGRLWIATENAGVGRLDPGGRFRQPEAGCQDACRISQLMLSGDGRVIAVGDHGAFVIDEQLRARPIAPSALGRVTSAAVDVRGGLWLTDRKRILSPGSEQPFVLPDGGEVLRLFADARGVWAAGARLWHLDPVGGAQRAYPELALPRVHSLAVDTTGAHWIGTESNGVWRIPGGHAAPEAVAIALFNPVLLPDSDGAMWIGGDGQGLTRWSPPLIGGIGGPGSALPAPTMAVLPGATGELWIGAFCGGLYRLAPDARLTVFELPEVEAACVWSLAPDGTGGVLVGYDRGHIARLDAQGRPLRSWRLPEEPRVRAIYLDPSAQLWVGGSQGLWRGTLDGELEPVPAFGQAEIATIRPVRDGGLWIGSDAGVALWRDDRVVRGIGTAAGLGSRFVRAIYEDPRGVLWIGTYGGGLHRIEGERLQRYTASEGLAENFVSCILEDERGRLWLAGNRGLSSIDRTALDHFKGRLLSPTLYNRSAGMPVSETNGGGASSCAIDAEGRLLFALISGVAVVDPARIVPSTRRPGPAVDLIEARIDGLPVEWREGLVIGASAATLALRYTAPSLAGGERLQFRYRLDGPWIEVGRTREILLSALPYGDWQLELAARLDGGPWTPTPTRLAVSRPPPWHGDPRVHAGAALLALLAGALGIRGYTLALRQRAARLDQLVAERTAALAEANQQLARLARTDPLTGVGNRRGFVERLEHDWKAARCKHQPLSLIALDVDSFKAYNDHYGHPAGDACLQRVAGILRERLAQWQGATEYLLARIGGEEFVVLLRGLDAAGACALAEALRRAVADAAIVHSHSPVADRVTISLGVASAIPQADDDPQSLLARADAALYRAKAEGRNRVIADA